MTGNLKTSYFNKESIMKKIIIAAALAMTAASPAYAMTYYLTSQWLSSTGNRMCAYGNGTVLNVGYRICPLSIQG